MNMIQVLLGAVVALCIYPVSATEDQRVTPIEQVLTMLTGLQEKVVVEGKAEARTYNEFACFCKDTTDEKNSAITDGQTTVDNLVGKINSRTSDRSEIDGKIEELNTQIAELDDEMAKETKAHKEAKKAFEAEDAEKQGSISGIDDALKQIQAGAGHPTGIKMVAIRKSLKNIRKSLMLADALGFGRPEAHRQLATLLEMSQEPVNYEQHEDLDAAVDTLDNLEKDFMNQKEVQRAAERKRVFAYDSFMQQRTDEKNMNLKNLKKNEQLRGQKMSEIAQMQSELTEAQATLHDDQGYIKDLISKCNAKSDEWDQRSKMRTDELAAITNAIQIISTTVKEKGKSLKRFLQVSTPSEVTSAHSDSISTASDEHILLQRGHARSQLRRLVATASAVHHAPENQELRTEVLDLLKTKGQDLKSTMLMNLAVQAAADPFAKIKVLVEELINRLNAEAADEGSHKGWCDKEMGKATATRANKAENIAMINNHLDTLGVKKEKLSDNIDMLELAISDLEDADAKFKKARAEEKAENENTISEAKDGLQAVKDAKDVLKEFYGQAAEHASLLQRSVEAKPYKGDQEGGANIIALMDVIQSDFKHTIKATKAQEEDAEREFSALSRTTKASIETKKAEKEAKESELTEHSTQYDKKFEDLKSNQELLDKAIQEMLELRSACIETGMSYEERVEKRQEEMESLKQALCLLEQQGNPAADPSEC